MPFVDLSIIPSDRLRRSLETAERAEARARAQNDRATRDICVALAAEIAAEITTREAFDGR